MVVVSMPLVVVVKVVMFVVCGVLVEAVTMPVTVAVVVDMMVAKFILVVMGEAVVELKVVVPTAEPGLATGMEPFSTRIICENTRYM